MSVARARPTPLQLHRHTIHPADPADRGTRSDAMRTPACGRRRAVGVAACARARRPERATRSAIPQGESGGTEHGGSGGGGSVAACGAGARDGGRWRRREGGQQREAAPRARASRWSTRRSGRAHSRARPRLSDAQGSNLRAPSPACSSSDSSAVSWTTIGRTGSTGGAAANPLSPAEMWQEMKIGIYLRRDVADRVCCVRR